MSLNPFERALWIDIRLSRRLQTLLTILVITAMLSIWLCAWSLPLKLVFSLLLLLYVSAELPLYGLSPLRLLANNFNRYFSSSLLNPLYRSAITGLSQHQQAWRVHFANGRQVTASLQLPVWRWRYLLLLRFELQSSGRMRRFSLLLTPWQVAPQHFRLLYARLAWAKEAGLDG